MGKLSALKEGLERAIKHIDAAKAAANAELARQFDIDRRLPGYHPPEAKVDDILGDARYFDEDGDPLQSFYDEVGRRQAALEVPQKVEGISDINSAHHLAQADAFKAMLDDAKIPYEENISSSSSRYVTVDGKKYRFSNHFKTTNPTNHARPDVNVAPGGNTFEDAIASAFSPAQLKALDMSQAARMQRAAEQGFDVSDPLYHASKTVFAGSDAAKTAKEYGLDVAEEFKKAKGGTYFTKSAGDVEQLFGGEMSGNAGEYLVRKGNVFDARWKAMGEDKKQQLKDMVYSAFDEDDINTIREKIGQSDWDPFEAFTDGELWIEAGRGKQDEIVRKIMDSGYDTVVFPDAFSYGHDHVSTVVKDPSQIRSINAAFDPAQKESSNLLASLAPAAVGTGLAALGLNPQETYAAINNYMQATQGSNPILENLNRNLQQFGMNERGQMQTGTMQATPHPMLGQVADVVRIPQAPGLGPLFGGAADYLDKLAQGQDVTYYDRLGAALDVIP